MTYKCKECGSVFDEPEIIKTTHNSRYEAHGYEEYGKCPNCPSDEFIECVICDYCGEAVANDIDDYVYFKERDENICNDCLHDYCVENYSYRGKLTPDIFPERLINLRKKRKLTQKKVCKNLLITQPNYSHYENGRRLPTLNNLIDIANYFGVSTDFLLGG